MSAYPSGRSTCRIATSLCVAWILALATTAAAQEPGDARGPATVEPRPPLVPTSTTPEQLYEDAVDALASNERARAASILKKLAADFSGSPRSARAIDLLARMSVPIRDSPRAPDLRLTTSPNEFRLEEKTGLARAELISFQTIAGIVTGGELCVLLECDDTRAVIASLLLGGAAGVTISTLASSDGITPGHATSLNSGTLWGAWNGLSLAILADVSDEQQGIGITLLGQLIGTGLGQLFHELFRPSAGDVSLSTSAGIWAGAATLFLHGMTEFDADERLILGTVLLASDLGLVTGALLTKGKPMSRGRVLLIDASGILGTLTGVGLDLLIQGEDPEAAPLFGLGLAGMVGGLVLGTYLTREWDLEAPIQLSFLPLHGGGSVGISATW